MLGIDPDGIDRAGQTFTGPLASATANAPDLERIVERTRRCPFSVCGNIKRSHIALMSGHRQNLLAACGVILANHIPDDRQTQCAVLIRCVLLLSPVDPVERLVGVERGEEFGVFRF